MHIKYYSLPHFNERPDNTQIDTLVIHSMYAKDYTRPCAAINCFKVLDENKVSSHFSIDRNGQIWQHVEASKRAWHAGKSLMPQTKTDAVERQDVNNFSIGIELIGVWGSRFKGKQYRSLAKLVLSLAKDFPINTIVSHQKISPDRKQDPGPSFDWNKLKRKIRKNKLFAKLLP